MTKTVLFALFLGAVVFGAENAGYVQSIRAWQQHRDRGLRSPDGWLTLAGLFWLEPGHKETIGSSPNADFPLPHTSAPAVIGTLELQNGKVLFTDQAGNAVAVDGKPGAHTVELSLDDEHPTVVKTGPISFFAIKRGDRIGIRVKNNDSPVLKNFKGMTFFPINPALHFANAKLISDPKKIPILNVLGQTELEDSPGSVQFTYRGKSYELRPIYEGKTLFFLFKDPSGKYHAGRMLNTPLPVNGIVDLDFNKAYNPPCVFTPYATCPLPPKQNYLPFPVEAGEKSFTPAQS